MNKLQNKLIFFLFIHLSLQANISYAQAEWSVNPADYEYNMTIIGISKLECTEMRNANDRIAAFINGECRGVQDFNTLYDNRQMAFLSIYDNDPSGAEISFKYYSEASNMVYDILLPLGFEENATVGLVESPYEFKTSFDLAALLLDNTNILDTDPAGTTIGQLSAFDEMGTDIQLQYDFLNDTLGIDNAAFRIENSQLILNTSVDFVQQSSYQIHLQAKQDNGCELSEVFVLEVQNTNQAPSGVDQSGASIEENQPPGSLVMELIAIDETVSDLHQFSLLGSEQDWPDHAFFEIVDNELRATISFDYEQKKLYQLQIQITDRVGNMVLDTVGVNIIDVIEFDDLKAGNLITPDGDGWNDFFSISNIDLYQNYELCIFNGNGKRVFQQSSNYQNNWDGKNDQGDILINGTYYFTFTDNDNSNNRFTGSIHLYRNNKF